MKRFKRHKVKTEMPESSASNTQGHVEHDLAYYIHDRVELMHQVFSVLKYKELKAMAPACVRNISVDDLQELCTEELLGISSKRLCAILDGAEPPSDTESSSQSQTEPLETISLDSISSDEEILSQGDKSKKKKHKHRRRDSKSKSSKRKKSKETDNGADAEKSKASRAGLTVLELLELQARARAIRAQLQNEQKKPASTSAAGASKQSDKSESSEDDEVEIKEEPAEVVEISSDEEKPKVEDLEKGILPQTSSESPSKTVTKRVKDLIITVPHKKTQKIKLNRNKSVPQDTTITKNKESPVKPTEKVINDIPKENTTNNKPKDDSKTKENPKKDKSKEKSRKKKKKKRLSTASDNDEITLQLSDTEKMDLLEDLDRKNYDNVSSSYDSSSDSESDKDICKEDSQKHKEVPDPKLNTSEDVDTSKDGNVEEKRIPREGRKSKDEIDKSETIVEDVDNLSHTKTKNMAIVVEEQLNVTDSLEIKETETLENEKSNNTNENVNLHSTSRSDIKNVDEDKPESVDLEPVEKDSDDVEIVQNDELAVQNAPATSTENSNKKEKSSTEPDDCLVNQDEPVTQESEKTMSEGELSDRESSEVEAFDLQPEVVCISDEEEGKHRKKKKKKDKKSKKEKKSKKKDTRDREEQKKDSNNSIKVVVSFPTDEEDTVHRKVIDNLEPLKHSEDVQKESVEKEQLDDSNNSIKVVVSFSTDEEDVVHRKVIDNLAQTKIPEDLTKESDSKEKVDNDSATPKNNQDITMDITSSDDESPHEIVEISDEVYELSDDSSNDDDTATQNVLSKEPTASEIEALSARIDEIERVEVITDEEIKEYEAKRADEAEEINISWKDRYLDSKKVRKVLNTSNILNALKKKNRELKKRLEESKVESQEKEDIQEEQTETKDIEIPEGSIEHYNTLEGSTKFVDPVKEAPINDTLKKDAKQLLRMYKKLLKYNDMNKKKDPAKKKKSKKKSKKAKEIVEDTTNKVNL